MKNKYKVVALVPLEFSVEGNSDSKEAIESVKNINMKNVLWKNQEFEGLTK